MGRFVIALMAGAILLAGAALPGIAKEKGTSAAFPPALENLFGGPFSLLDQNGVRRADTDFRGKYMLIFFGYTYCPTICPTNLEHMAWALDKLGDQADAIQPIFITIDPERDTPELLKEYLASFGPDFVGLSGDEAEISRVAKAYRIHRVKVVPEGSQANDYLVDHSSITYLMGPDGKFVTLFPHNTAGDVMAERIGAYFSAN